MVVFPEVKENRLEGEGAGAVNESLWPSTDRDLTAGGARGLSSASIRAFPTEDIGIRDRVRVGLEFRFEEFGELPF